MPNLNWFSHFVYSHNSFWIGAFIYIKGCDHIRGNLWRPHHFSISSIGKSQTCFCTL